jgi:hypothetical protein
MSSSPAKELTPAQRVAARERFLRRVVNFTVDLLVDHGRIVHESQGSGHTHIIRELLDFEDFSFKTDLGQTMMGGNDITIWYHPTKEFGLLRDDSQRRVLKVYSETLPLSFEADSFRLECFEESTPWQTFILNLMKNKKKILSKIATAQRRAKRTEERLQAAERKEKEFRARAKRVRISVG